MIPNRSAWNALPWHERALMRELYRRGASHRRIARAFARNRGTVHWICADITRPRSRFQCVTYVRRYARERRAELRSHKLCINGGSHGPATHGVLCAACRATHRRTA